MNFSKEFFIGYSLQLKIMKKNAKKNEKKD